MSLTSDFTKSRSAQSGVVDIPKIMASSFDEIRATLSAFSFAYESDFTVNAYDETTRSRAVCG